MAAWWAQLLSSAASTPTRIVMVLSALASQDKPTTQFHIQNANNPTQLTEIIKTHHEEILRQDVCLAHARIQASQMLLTEVYRCVQLLESLAIKSRTEMLHMSDGTYKEIGWRMTGASSFSRKQALQKNLSTISKLITALHEFVGIHTEDLHQVRLSLSEPDPQCLGHAILTCADRAKRLTAVVMEGGGNDHLATRIRQIVLAGLQTAGRQFESPESEEVAGQFGRFWRQGSDARPTEHRSAYDRTGVLDDLKNELQELSGLRRHLTVVLRDDLLVDRASVVQAVQRGGLGIVCVESVRRVCVHARFLGGTGLLEDVGRRHVGLVSTVMVERILKPAKTFYDNVFAVDDSSGSEESVGESRESLRKMLMDFTEQTLFNKDGAKQLAEKGSTKAVTEIVTEQARYPIRNAIFGSLWQAIFLQVQKMKCDVEDLMMKSKRVLKAQELNLALVALIPAVMAIAYLVYVCSTVVYIWRSRDKDVIVSAGQTVVFMLRDVHAILVELEGVRDAGRTDASTECLQYLALLGGLHAKVFELEEFVNSGLIDMGMTLRLRFARETDMLQTRGLSFERRRKHAEGLMQSYGSLFR